MSSGTPMPMFKSNGELASSKLACLALKDKQRTYCYHIK